MLQSRLLSLQLLVLPKLKWTLDRILHAWKKINTILRVNWGRLRKNNFGEYDFFWDKCGNYKREIIILVLADNYWPDLVYPKLYTVKQFSVIEGFTFWACVICGRPIQCKKISLISKLEGLYYGKHQNKFRKYQWINNVNVLWTQEQVFL